MKKIESYSLDDSNWWASLPFHIEDPKISLTQRPVGFRFFKYPVIIHAKVAAKTIVSAGEDHDLEVATSKAMGELFERAALLDFTLKDENSISSNGWAAHLDTKRCFQNAMLELVERDGVLAQWYSSAPFLVVAPDQLPGHLRHWVGHELSHSEFPMFFALLSTKGIGPSVTVFFLNQNGFGVSGHSTRIDLVESIESAISEACRAAHLYVQRAYWADTMVLLHGSDARIQPAAHALYYAYHESFPHWIYGRSLTFNEAECLWDDGIQQLLRKRHEFKFSLVFDDPLAVGFATHPRVFTPHWGKTQVEMITQSEAGRRLALNKNNINLMPHIMA